MDRGLNDVYCGLAAQKTYLEEIGAGVAEQKRAVKLMNNEFAALKETNLCTNDDITRMKTGLILQKQSIDNLQRDVALLTK